ncbi:DENN domain-containing protein 1B isoform X2 [Syngnathus typhle]|uniref:DENN domain-containing protein 1B isoform X2 n=1 Tax=Syngnathus typhle TaxID=161592 RepID=UPI002A6A2290|nr:DENN domain-containing protein 1B isoform X2 [Syngnathus typhle]
MGSRIRQNPERAFIVFFEASCPIARDEDPGVCIQFPDDFRDEESCQTLTRFCFPYDIQSYLPWFEVFYKVLNTLAVYISKGQTNEMNVMLAALYNEPIPLTAGSITLQMVPYFMAPDLGLPSVPENRNLTELVVSVDVTNLLQLYASMLFERRIIIFARKLSTLTSCVHALGALLYPMHWQHIFIPVLPPHLLDYCCAPMPYLIGVHSSLSERVRSQGLEGVVILNVDANTLETPFNDLKKIPSHVRSALKVCLKSQVVSAGCGVSRAFLKAQSVLFGGYKDALQNHKAGGVCFSKDLFLDHKSSSMRQFLQSAIHLQFFKQFIDERLDILNTGKVPQDLCEEEILECETTGKRKSYIQLVDHIKKGGGALILNMKSKTNNIRATGIAKSGLKNRSKNKAFSQTQAIQRGGSLSHRSAPSDCLQNGLPNTQHFAMSRPRGPGSKLGVTRGQEAKAAGDAWNGAMSGPREKHDSELEKDDEKEEELLCDREEMDLLSEIFDTLSTRSSHERGQLYGTRSLDLFGPDCHDYITKFSRVNPSQESLSLSTSGSGSLHSWNPEQSEEVQTLTEITDWLTLDDASVEQAGVLRSVGDPQENSKLAINVTHGIEVHNRTSSKEVKFEAEISARKVTLKQGIEEEIAERLEDEVLKKMENGANLRQNEKKRGEKKTAEIEEDATKKKSRNLVEKNKEAVLGCHLSSEGFLEESRNKNLSKEDSAGNSSNTVQTYQSYNTSSHSDSHSTIKHEQGGPVTVKVSEFKKMFEATRLAEYEIHFGSA